MNNLNEVLDKVNQHGLENINKDEKKFLDLYNQKGRKEADKEIKRRNEAKDTYKNFLNINLKDFDSEDDDINFNRFNQENIMEIKHYFLWNYMLKEHKEQFINEYSLDITSSMRWDNLNDCVKSLFIIYCKNFK